MKSILLSLLLFFCVAAHAGPTDGVVYVAQPTECHLIAQNGVELTNKLVIGKTYSVMNNNCVEEFTNANKSTYYLSGGTIVSTGTNSTFSIDVFDQEVNNLSDQPRAVDVGAFNLSLTLSSGEFIVICPIFPEGSSFTINTPFASYELSAGDYLFHVTDKSVMAYVQDGMLQVHGDKTVEKSEPGKLAMALQFHDPSGTVDDKVITSVKSAKSDEAARYKQTIVDTVNSLQNIQFVVISGKVVGVLMPNSYTKPTK